MWGRTVHFPPGPNVKVSLAKTSNHKLLSVALGTSLVQLFHENENIFYYHYFFLLIFLYRGIRWSVILKTAYILITRFMQKRITKAEEELGFNCCWFVGNALLTWRGRAWGQFMNQWHPLLIFWLLYCLFYQHVDLQQLRLLTTTAVSLLLLLMMLVNSPTAWILAYSLSSPGLIGILPQQVSTETPVVKTALFAFSDLHLYLNVKPPGSSKVSWHLNSFSWPARPWDWSDLSAEAFKRMPSRTAEQRKPTTDQGLCIYLDL